MVIRFWARTLPATLTWPEAHVRLVAEMAGTDPARACATDRRTTVVVVFPTSAPKEIGSVRVRITSTWRCKPRYG